MIGVVWDTQEGRMVINGTVLSIVVCNSKVVTLVLSAFLILFFAKEMDAGEAGSMR